MKLILVPPHMIDYAWNEGAVSLCEACETSGGEVTGDQLKMLLARGERVLLKMEHEGVTTGWGVIRVDQLPNFRVLHACEMVAHNANFPAYFDALKDIAKAYGCSRIRCSAKPAQARLYRMKIGFSPVYETLEVVL